MRTLAFAFALATLGTDAHAADYIMNCKFSEKDIAIVNVKNDKVATIEHSDGHKTLLDLLKVVDSVDANGWHRHKIIVMVSGSRDHGYVFDFVDRIDYDAMIDDDGTNFRVPTSEAAGDMYLSDPARDHKYLCGPY